MSERKQLQELLRIFQDLEEVVVIFDSEFRVLHLNHATEKLYGITETEAVGHAIEEFLTVYQAQTSRDETREILAKKGQWRGDVGYRIRNGKQIFVDLSVSKLDAERYGIDGFISISRDITNRKNAELAAQQNEKTLHNLIEFSPLPIAINDRQGKIIHFNRKLQRKLGYTLEEIPNLEQWWLLAYPDPDYRKIAMEKWLTAVEEALTTGFLIDPMEFKVTARDGSVFDIEFHTAAIGENIITIFKDMTEIRRSEEELSRGRNLVSRVMETSPVGITVVDREGNITFANPGAEQVLGLRKDEITQRYFNSIEWKISDEDGNDFPPENLPFNLVKRTKKPVSNIRHAIQSSNRPRVLLSINATPLFDEAGNFDGMVAALTNITDQQKAQRAEREKHSQLQTLIEAIPDIVYFKDAQGRNLIVNKVFAELVGLPREQVEGKTDAELLPPDLAEHCRKSDEEVYRSKETLRFEEKAVGPDGKTTYFDSIKRPIFNEEGNAIGMVGVSRDVTENKLVQDALRISEERLQLAFEAANDGMWDHDILSGVSYYSPRWFGMLGYAPGEVPGDMNSLFALLHPDDRDRIVSQINEAVEKNLETYSAEFRLRTKSGGWRWIYSRGKVVEWDEQGKARRIVGTHVDITDRVKAEQAKGELEEQLRQAQKMEAIGRLAGGIAHDFNNILTGINGYSEMILASLGEGDPLYNDVSEIRAAAERAAGLTQQLLAFSRKQIISPRPLKLNDIVVRAEKMLARIIGEDIELKVSSDHALWTIKADPGQMDQILVNVAANARDAMPDGGQLVVETKNVVIDENHLGRYAGIRSGNYVLLKVGDTGQGMNEETLSHIFEPFFSTKEKDKGTGLGLATVYGIVRQNGGVIDVESTVGHGTTFFIFFPAVAEEAEQLDKVQPTKSPIGEETILLVEDEDLVRTLAERILIRHGYQVVTASDGGEAYLKFRKKPAQIDLLLTDVVMPGMNGRDLYEQLQQIKPDLKVLFMSGYTEDAIAHHGVLDEGVAFIQKPFNIEALARKVREVLDR